MTLSHTVHEAMRLSKNLISRTVSDKFIRMGILTEPINKPLTTPRGRNNNFSFSIIPSNSKVTSRPVILSVGNGGREVSTVSAKKSRVTGCCNKRRENNVMLITEYLFSSTQNIQRIVQATQSFAKHIQLGKGSAIHEMEDDRLSIGHLRWTRVGYERLVYRKWER
jgi:hypothetical protein